MMKIKIDKLFAIVCLIIAAVLFVNTGTIKDIASKSDPGARLFPYIGEGLLAFSAVWMLFSKSDQSEDDRLDKKGWKKLLFIFGLMALYVFALEYVGFIISTIIFVMVFVYILSGEEKTNLITAIVLSLALAFGLYFLFTKGFSIMLPKGALIKRFF